MHRLRLCAVIALLVGVLRSNHLPAQSAFLAPTPQVGWNSWDSYGTTVREQQVKANADVMTSDLARYGWKYIVLDIQWYEPNVQGHEYKPGAATENKK